ncbi:hypothetical protein [Coleofasciculus sp. LEGE 07092]|uniref:hypothetical protein n=1 Tax=Coleofasciculus sp. LEGE 07092 TaxID=2777969 RepID=UPI00188107BB|nr:hypothetical protein [Coleofasciculus sp. LEGE 07092]MBE9151823.1 hypothetical protein [Coleofasciculus sp. LEGE 07092]
MAKVKGRSPDMRGTSGMVGFPTINTSGVTQLKWCNTIRGMRSLFAKEVTFRFLRSRLLVTYHFQ